MQRPLSRTLLLLLAMAGLAAGLAALGGRHPAAVAAILALAFAKGRLVVYDFMALRGRAGLLPAACLFWCGALLALAFARFLFAG